MIPLLVCGDSFLHRRFATLDVGSNSTVLLIIEITRSGALVLVDRADITQLGQGVRSTGKLSPEALQRTLTQLAEYQSQVVSLGAEWVGAVATAAVRDAANGHEFIAQVRAMGIALQIISGDEEAALSLLSVLFEQPLKQAFMIDIGGGSTEYALALEAQAASRISLPLGAVHLTERFLTSDPPSLTQRRALQEMIVSELHKLPPIFHTTKAPLLSACGTVTTACAVQLELLKYEGALVHQQHLSSHQVENMLERLMALPVNLRGQVAGLDSKRAKTMIAGLMILLESMRALGKEQLTVLNRGIRYGLLWRSLSRLGIVEDAAFSAHSF